MVRKSDVTHIDQVMKAYAEKHGLKGIKIDYEDTQITDFDGVIHFTYETSIPDTCPHCKNCDVEKSMQRCLE